MQLFWLLVTMLIGILLWEMVSPSNVANTLQYHQKSEILYQNNVFEEEAEQATRCGSFVHSAESPIPVIPDLSRSSLCLRYDKQGAARYNDKGNWFCFHSM